MSWMKTKRSLVRSDIVSCLQEPKPSIACRVITTKDDNSNRPEKQSEQLEDICNGGNLTISIDDDTDRDRCYRGVEDRTFEVKQLH